MSINHQPRPEPEAPVQDSQLRALSSSTISYAAIRQHFAQDHGPLMHRQLEWGRKVLRTEQELAQYLYSYGPMTQRQWSSIFGAMPLPSEDFAVIDYAAGQGLATVHLLDRLGANRHLVKRCTLTDASTPALARAAEILSIYSEALDINPLYKDLGEIEIADLYIGDGERFVHLLSNIIDIDTFDLSSLFSKILSKNGFHQLMAVSPSRDFAGGDIRFDEMSNWLKDADKRGEIELLGGVQQQTFQDGNGWDHSLCVARCEVTNGSL